MTISKSYGYRKLKSPEVNISYECMRTGTILLNMLTYLKEGIDDVYDGDKESFDSHMRTVIGGFKDIEHYRKVHGKAPSKYIEDMIKDAKTIRLLGIEYDGSLEHSFNSENRTWRMVRLQKNVILSIANCEL